MLYLLVRGIVLQVAWRGGRQDTILLKLGKVAEFVMGRYERFGG
jgi:hypothetical protein